MGEKSVIGKKSFQFVLIVSIILILSLSIVSASFFGNLLKSLGFGDKPLKSVGFAASGTSNCYDSDGKDNFGVAGYVDVVGQSRYSDSCASGTNTAKDWYCCDPDVDPRCGGNLPTLAFFLPFTGRAIDTQVAASTLKDCATITNLCLGGACVACVDGSACGPSTDVGECAYGYSVCSNGAFVDCIGDVYPATEVCNDFKDNDCDSYTDGADTDCGTPFCPPGNTTNCIVTGKLGVCAQGQKTCAPDGSAWGFCTQTTQPSAEVCNDVGGLDEDCDGNVNCADSNCTSNPACVSCPNGVCGAGETCSTCSQDCGTCKECQDTIDNDGDGKIDYSATPGVGDAGCTGVTDNDETNCGDSICEGGETSTTCLKDCPLSVQCDDNLDNDGDTKIDYPADPGCTGLSDNNETNICTYSCGTKNCGNVTDSCDVSRSCGTCNAGYSCNSSQVCESTCVDADGDTYSIKDAILCPLGKDCNDTNRDINPGAAELCDNIDQDCDANGAVANNVSEQICGPTGVSLANTSICKQGKLFCSAAGVLSQCAGAVYPASNETCDDKIDNNCVGGIDEGCGCTNGQTKSCDPNKLCKEGKQTCTNLTWGTCQVVGNITGCNVNTACSVGVLEVCGSNVGECQVGSKTCSSSGQWGTCDDVGPSEEICEGLDNNCDGIVDEGCSSSVAPQDDGGSGEPQEDISSTDIDGDGITDGSSEEQSEENLGFWGSVLKFLERVFNVVRVLLTPLTGGITDTVSSDEPAKCADADGGISYFVKGSGKGLTQDDREVWFQDFCYENDMNNQLETCAGDNCYLAEKYCEGNKVKTEINVVCDFGCTAGACIPTADDSEACQQYFDRDLWEWVSPCA